VLDFPATPTNGQVYPATPTPGIPNYFWDGEKWMATATSAPPLGGGAAGDALPLKDGVAAVGTSTEFAREDHRHPTDAPPIGMTLPLMNGVPNAGSSLAYSRADHVHPTDATITGGLQGKVSKAGDVMSGHLIIPASPPADGATRKDYVDAGDANKLIKTGDVMTGDLTVYRAGAPTTGYIFYGNTGQKYFGFDGTNFFASANITVSQINGDAHQSTGPNLILGGAGGSVYLRPNGVGSASGEAYQRSDGYFIVPSISSNYIVSNGAILAAGNLTANGTISSGIGYQCKSGYSGGLGGNWFNMQWFGTGAGQGAHLYIDDAAQGQVWTDARMPRSFGRAGWHQFCPGGMMIQWGTNVINLDGAGLTPIVYPTSFPNATMAFVAMNGDSGNGADVVISVYGGSGYPYPYQAAVYGYSSLSHQPAVSRTMRIDWIAFGY
jgi:hypothetical protein